MTDKDRFPICQPPISDIRLSLSPGDNVLFEDNTRRNVFVLCLASECFILGIDVLVNLLLRGSKRIAVKGKNFGIVAVFEAMVCVVEYASNS